MITAMMTLTKVFTPLKELTLEVKMDPEFSPVHRGSELPQLILHLSARVLSGQVFPVLGDDEAADDAGALHLASSFSGLDHSIFCPAENLII